MSRGFGSTYGVGNGDLVTESASMTESSSAMSVAFWFYLNGVGQGGFGVPVVAQNAAGTVNSWSAYINNNTTQLVFQQNMATLARNMQFTIPGTGQWTHFCVANNPSLTGTTALTAYVNGAVATPTQLAAGSGSPVTTIGSITVGNGKNSGNTWDGMIAHCAFWNGVQLTAAEALALASGANPLLVRPDSLAFYTPLDGVSNPEVDFINGPTATPTGTWLGKSEPPVQFTGNYRNLFDPALMPRFAGSLALTQGAQTAALSLREKFRAQLALTAPDNQALLWAYEIADIHPGRLVIGDTAVGGFLATGDNAKTGLALADAALYDVQITETV